MRIQNYLRGKGLIVNKFSKIVNKEVFIQSDGGGMKRCAFRSTNLSAR